MPESNSSFRAPTNYPMQAVVVVHGMGEQTPMGTIKNFVEAVWVKDKHVHKNGMPNSWEVWSKPDIRTGSLELRRITTRPCTPKEPNSDDGTRTDFYELYWADLNAGSTLGQVENWIFGLLFRCPFRTIPPRLIPAWGILWLLTLVIAYLALTPVIEPELAVFGLRPYAWVDGSLMKSLHLEKVAGPIIAAGLAYLGNKYLVATFGRVVRYIRAKPDNIKARKKTRERGLALLNALHDGSYERIIIVGHSLGSILGYDLISYFWTTRTAAYTFAQNEADFKYLVALEVAVDSLEKAKTAEAVASAKAKFETARCDIARVLRQRPKPQEDKGETGPGSDKRWLITDFITLGSPLTHSEFLLNADHQVFKKRKKLRELPTAPPVREKLDLKNQKMAGGTGFPVDEGGNVVEAFSFPFVRKDDKRVCWQLHHAAPFAVVRWTNIYDHTKLYVSGDIISGPLAPGYGLAVRDVDLRTCSGARNGIFTHTKYWELKRKQTSTAAVVQLRTALNLRGEGDI